MWEPFLTSPLCSAATYKQPMPLTKLQRWHGRMRGRHWSCCVRPLVERPPRVPCQGCSGGEHGLPWPECHVWMWEGGGGWPRIWAPFLPPHLSCRNVQLEAGNSLACLSGGDGRLAALWSICFPPHSPQCSWCPACSWGKGFNTACVNRLLGMISMYG